MSVSTAQSTPGDNVALLLRELAHVRKVNLQLQRRVRDTKRSRDYWKNLYRSGRPQRLAADDPRHGTANGYNNLGCRCRRCRDAWNAWCLDYQHRTGRHKPRAEYVAERRAEAEARDSHGTESRYVNLGCRCDACRAASAEARRRRRREGVVATHNATGYRNGCRCDVCREAHRERVRKYRAA